MNRLISVGELRAVAIKHLVELSVEHEFFCHFFKRKTCHASNDISSQTVSQIERNLMGGISDIEIQNC